MPIHEPPHADAIRAQTRCWLEQFVLKHQLCPFARQPWDSGRVRLVVTDSARPEYLLEDLLQELQHLQATPVEQLETTLLIHPAVLEDFHDYNDFFDLAEELLVQEGLEGVFQIAGFHPDYQFADTHIDDAGNYTNRSPWPMLHLLREDSLERAIAAWPDDVGDIPTRNIALMQALGTVTLRDGLENCKGATS
ncbi:MAG: DUF1415 domain-containing protein [Thiolinea sp.]